MSHLIISEHQFINSSSWSYSCSFNIQLPQWWCFAIRLRKNVSGCSHSTPSSPASSGSLFAHQPSLMQSDNPKPDNWGNDIGDSKSRGTSKELEPNKWIQYTTTNGCEWRLRYRESDQWQHCHNYALRESNPPLVTNIKDSIDSILIDTQGHKDPNCLHQPLILYTDKNVQR